MIFDIVLLIVAVGLVIGVPFMLWRRSVARSRAEAMRQAVHSGRHRSYGVPLPPRKRRDTSSDNSASGWGVADTVGVHGISTSHHHQNDDHAHEGRFSTGGEIGGGGHYSTGGHFGGSSHCSSSHSSSSSDSSSSDSGGCGGGGD